VTRTPPPPVRVAGVVGAVLEDRVQLPRVYDAWHSVKAFSADDATLDVLANVLAGGRSSRLYRRLVYELQIATDVVAFQDGSRIDGKFELYATARPGHDLGELQRVIDEEVRKLADQGPTPREVERARTPSRHSSCRGWSAWAGSAQGGSIELLQLLRRDPGLLPEGPGAVRPRDAGGGAARGAHVPLAGPPRGAQRGASGEAGAWSAAGGAAMKADGRTGGRPDRGHGRRALPWLASGLAVLSASPLVRLSAQVDRTKPPVLAPPPTLKLPAVETTMLPNGLTLAVVEMHKVPVVDLQLLVDAGAARDPSAGPGLATFTATMLQQGAGARSALDVADEAAFLGAQLGTTASFDGGERVDPRAQAAARGRARPARGRGAAARVRRLGDRTAAGASRRAAGAAARRASGGGEHRVPRDRVRSRASVRAPAERHRQRHRPARARRRRGSSIGPTTGPTARAC